MDPIEQARRESRETRNAQLRAVTKTINDQATHITRTDDSGVSEITERLGSRFHYETPVETWARAVKRDIFTFKEQE